MERCTDTATLRQFQDRTPRVRFRPLSGFIFFPTGWKCQPEGEDIGSGCCGGGVIQLRSRERALLRQGQLFEPTASSGPAAMLLSHGILVVSPDGVLARADILSLWRPSFSPPSRTLVVSPGVPAQTDILSLLASLYKKRTPPNRQRPHKYHLQIPRRFRIV